MYRMSHMEDHGIDIDKKVKSTMAGTTWVALIAGMLLLVLLLIFIVQNQAPVEVQFFTWNFTLPTGVTILLSSIIGAAIMTLVGIIRMWQLRRQVKKNIKTAHEIEQIHSEHFEMFGVHDPTTEIDTLGEEEKDKKK